jgi:hypothetical protein
MGFNYTAIALKGIFVTIIDTEHMSAFGMTRDERREKLKLQSKGAAIDWDIYDIPTIHRK